MQMRALGWLIGVLCCSTQLACSGSRATSSGDGGTHADGSVDGGSCAQPFDFSAKLVAAPTGLRINEVLSANDGVNLDELGEADDWIELLNASPEPIVLAGYFLNDGKGDALALPNVTLGPGETYLLWADGNPEQGANHLDMKVSASGEAVVLWAAPCVLAERVEVPALPVNQSFARLPDGGADFAVCRYATPGRSNGASCQPTAPAELPDTLTFAPFVWSAPWPSSGGPLSIMELVLAADGFVELFNAGDSPLQLAEFALRLAAQGPGAAMPGGADGLALSLPTLELAPGARVAIDLTSEAVAELGPEGEGVLGLFRADGTVVDRIDFMRSPPGAALVREPRGPALFHYCSQPSKGQPGECAPLAHRETGDRIRHLRTPGDFAALAAGGTEIGQSAVKFIVDMQAGDVVHLLSSSWALHYTFIRERIYGEPALDRCDAAQSQLFNQGWYEFSEREYFRTVGRRFLLGTLVAHANGLHTVEFASGDTITAEQMKRAFFAAAARTDQPSQWAVRAQNADQLNELRKIEGQLPIVSPSAPFVGLSYQPLTHAVGFGVLKLVPAHQLMQAELGPQVIVVTDDVPNDIPFVGGLITEAFQTPLAHVNVLSQARGTPNMALRGAAKHTRLAPLLGKLVRLEVGTSDFELREASAEEADAFYQANKPSGPRVVAPHDSSARGVLSLSERSLADLPSIGAKAAQFAELYRVRELHSGCPANTVPLNVPEQAFAVPIVHYEEHLRASGAEARLAELVVDPSFRADPAVRAERLAALRTLITNQPVDGALLRELEDAIRARFGTSKVRMRSSSNVEDLPTFNGAGLHTSSSAVLDDPDESVADALRAVWASLWNMRAYDEREFANIDHGAARMAVLVHASFDGEGSQGVGISRNLLDVARSDIYYINAQRGEATVTNPAPAVSTEQLLYTWPPRAPEVTYQTLSSLNDGKPVLNALDIRAVACALGSVDAHFRPLLDPARLNRLFAMQIEFKVTRAHKLYVKQARPQPFGRVEASKDCREF